MASSAEVGHVIICHNVDEWKTNFLSAKESKKLVVVDFTASWCGPCRFIAPILDDLAKKLHHVIFLKVDVDDVRAVAEEYQVEAMPTFIFLREGNVVDKVVGANKDGLVKKITEHAAAAVTVTTVTA